MTPHVAIVDAENIPERRFEILLDNAKSFLSGEDLKNVVDKETWY
jgi:phosphoglycerate dehydrogenase-like enzyme